MGAHDRRLAQLLPASLRDSLDPAAQTLSLAALEAMLERTGGSGAPCCRPPDPRWQDRFIEDLVAPGMSVLDLGCGQGDLLARLIRKDKVRAQGVEKAAGAVLTCIRRGIPVIQADIDQGLSHFPNQSVDLVVLEETLQTLHNPLLILSEMLRVGRRGVVTFPNFGCWCVRLQLGLKGRMPVTGALPYEWHNTPNIHLFTLADFCTWAGGGNVCIETAYVLAEGRVRSLVLPEDNLLAEQVLLVISRENP